MRGDIRSAILHTASHGHAGNHSLCHGDLGNIELILEACTQFQEMPECGNLLQSLREAAVDGIRREGVLCESPLAVESVGLMTGLAGIGYGFLRLADPQRVPSVLLLECPQVAAAA